jgi:2-iminobutanoate/2-iminopropanoate deaminase
MNHRKKHFYKGIKHMKKTLFATFNAIFNATLTAVLISAASYTLAAEVEVLGADVTKKLNLPFSEAVAVGEMLYLSGQIGNLPGELSVVTGGIKAETEQTMKNIFSILRKYGSNPKKIVKCTIFLADMDEWDEMNEVYVSALGDHRPARSALGASGLALNSKVEIECLAAR